MNVLNYKTENERSMLFLLLTTSYKNGMKKWSRFFLTVVLCLVIIVYEPLAVLASCEIMEGSDESQFITEFTDGNSDAGETVQDRDDDMDLKNEDSDMQVWYELQRNCRKSQKEPWRL